MDQESINKLYNLLEKIPITQKNEKAIEEIKELIENGKLQEALDKLKTIDINKDNTSKEENEKDKKEVEIVPFIKKETKTIKKYPDELSDIKLEHIYMGLLLNNPEGIYKYYYLSDDCFFEDDEILNIYKSVLFTEGGSYTPEIAKKGFNFSKDAADKHRAPFALA